MEWNSRARCSAHVSPFRRQTELQTQVARVERIQRLAAPLARRPLAPTTLNRLSVPLSSVDVVMAPHG